MKIHIDMTPHAAASLAADLVAHRKLGAKLEAATRRLFRVLEGEEDRTDRVIELLERFRDADAFAWEIGPAESPEGEDLLCALEGEIDCELDLVLATRSDARKLGDALLDLVALLQSLELTEVRVKIGGRRASLDALSDAIVRLAGEHSVFLVPAAERRVEDLDEEDDLDDDDADLADDEEDELDEEDDLDDDDDDQDDEDDGGQDVGADGIPRDGWGARHPAPRHATLSPEEIFYLEVTELSWPCAPDVVRAGLRRVARYHPDLAAHDPALRAVRHEQFIRLNKGRDALLARFGSEVR